jgi:hypothetical protein
MYEPHTRFPRYLEDMTPARLAADNEVREATAEEGRELFDKRARELFGVTGEEWLRQWDAGEYRDSTDSKVITLAMLIPFARQ